MELLKRFCEIEDGQATIDNRLAGGAVEDSGVLALLLSGVDDPSETYLAFRQLADLEASLGAFSQRLACDPSGLPLSRAGFAAGSSPRKPPRCCSSRPTPASTPHAGTAPPQASD